MNQFRDKSSTQQRGSLKYLILIFFLVISIVLMGAVFFLLERHDRVSKAYLTLACLTAEQRLLSQNMVTQAFEVARGHEQAVDRLREIKQRFDDILAIQKNGGAAAHLPQMQDDDIRYCIAIQKNGGAAAHLPPSPPQVISYVNDLEARWQPVSAHVQTILDGRNSVLSVSGSLPSLLEGVIPRLLDLDDALLEAINKLLSEYEAAAAKGVKLFGFLEIAYLHVYIFGCIAIILILILSWQVYRDIKLRLLESEQRKQDTEDQNRNNQEAILRLLDELGDLAEGDLTVQASVTEDITGAIADSVNYAIEALRGLVSTINKTSEQLAFAAQETRNVADRLARASEVQARQIESASGTVTQMAQSMDGVSAKTAASAEVAEKSVHIAHEGGARVRRTIQGMDVIREHIQETSKRIKRLGESSQEIGDIVALINDIADQTNILALNAAIQASAAGEAGRGFAVVADEVQRLAERSSNATKRIEALVKTIQADTNEAVISMEKSTTEVVNGAGLAEKAGEALEEIETVSARLAALIDNVSKASRQVTEMASRVSLVMKSINEITAQTAESSLATASSIGKLNQLAQELQQSVAGFRLPQQTVASGHY
jgi:twitching motility protein PilJ